MLAGPNGAQRPEHEYKPHHEDDGHREEVVLPPARLRVAQRSQTKTRKTNKAGTQSKGKAKTVLKLYAKIFCVGTPSFFSKASSPSRHRLVSGVARTHI